MEYKIQTQSEKKITPRLIIHGGAGNIKPSNLPPAKYQQYHRSLLKILSETYYFQQQGHSALDTVTFAVSQLEDNPLFNSGHGAVFTRDGVNELEVSVMVSKGKKKRGVGLMGLRHVKNPVKLAREMLIRGEDDLEGGNGEHRGPMNVSEDDDSAMSPPSGGAQGHCQLHGEGAEKLAKKWGLEMVEPSYYFVQARWDEHVAGLEREKDGKGHASYDVELFVPQGTCGAVALDSDGVCAVATSTGGMTNKLTGRIGDTPTLGAGFWAEEWEEIGAKRGLGGPPTFMLSETLQGLVADCLPNLRSYSPLATDEIDYRDIGDHDRILHSTAISGTGNGDSFLRTNAVRTASAIVRYTRPIGHHKTSLQDALTQVTGPGGDLEKSAGNRWKKTGEGEGGMIGIDLIVVADENGDKKVAVSHIVDDYNCAGMFRAAVDKNGKAVCRIWRPGQYNDLEGYEDEGREYDPKEWLGEKRGW